MFPSGQPLWQKGMPQSMQRAPCCCSFSSGILRSYSRQSVTRSRTGRREDVSRLISMKPVKLDHSHVASRREAAVVVEHVGDSAAHSGGEVAPSLAEHDDQPARHVLASMVADTFDHGRGAAVAHGEALAGHASEERLAGGCAVERDVSDENVLLGLERRLTGRTNCHEAA